jgi:heme exporter protein D
MFDFDAGKYAIFVWPAYAITAVVFIVMIADSLLRARRWRKAVEAREAEGKDRDVQAEGGQ